MNIERKENEGQGRFFIEENGSRIALMTYEKTGANEITINHTEVDSNHRGENLGKDLVTEAVKFARENDLKIAATCPFARKVLSAATEFDDVFVSE